MKKMMRSALFMVFVCLPFLAVHAEGVVGVRLTDLEKHASGRAPYVGLLHDHIEASQSALFVSQEILNVFLESEPKRVGQTWSYEVTAFVKNTSGQLRFERMNAEVNTQTSQVRAWVRESVSLAQTDFIVEVALVERLVVLRDRSSSLLMIFPIGVGSFDEGVLNREYSLLTPRFKNAYLSKRVAIESRTTPRYFAGKPFIRLLDGEQKAHTPIGFHAQPNLDAFIRGFDSHGCIRMQLEDLMALYEFVARHPETYIPLTVSYHLDESYQHPFPKRDRSFQTIQNVGTRSNPEYTIDRDYLVQTTYVNRQPPVEQLYDFAEDNNEEYFNYSSEPCRVKSFGKEPRSGWPASLTSTLAWQRCAERTRRNRLYRWWVHR